MFPDNTVFILGAGSSKPYGLPLGSEINSLIIEVSKSLQSSNIWKRNPLIDDLLKIMNELDFNKSELISFASTLRKSNISSIDRFLNIRRNDYGFLGKHLLSFFLLEFEKEQNVFSNSNVDDWLKFLWNKYICQKSLEDFNNANVSFLTFNYDRVLEYFLINSISESYGVSKIVAVNVLENIKVIHIHGQIGFLHKEPSLLENRDFFTDFIHFNSDINFNTVTRAAKSIRLIHETREKNYLKKIIEDILINAQTIYFLGFGYDKMNIETLGLDKIDLSDKSIYGTAFGMNEKEINEINIGNCFKKCVFENKTSLELLRQYL